MDSVQNLAFFDYGWVGRIGVLGIPFRLDDHILFAFDEHTGSEPDYSQHSVVFHPTRQPTDFHRVPLIPELHWQGEESEISIIGLDPSKMPPEGDDFRLISQSDIYSEPLREGQSIRLVHCPALGEPFQIFDSTIKEIGDGEADDFFFDIPQSRVVMNGISSDVPESEHLNPDDLIPPVVPYGVALDSTSGKVIGIVNVCNGANIGVEGTADENMTQDMSGTALCKIIDLFKEHLAASPPSPSTLTPAQKEASYLCHEADRLYWDLSDWPGAVQMATRALEIDPTCLRALGARADAYRMNDQFDLARADIDRAIALDPEGTYPRVYRTRSEMTGEQGDNVASEAAATRAIEIHDLYCRAHVSRARARYWLRSYASVDEDATTALDLNPRDDEAFYFLAESHRMRKMCGKSIIYARRCQQLSPDDSSIYECLGDCFCSTGQTEKALQHASRAIELNPRSGFAYRTQVQCFLALEKLEEALVAANKSVEVQPDAVRGYLARAKVHTAMRRFDLAYNDCIQGRRLESGNTEIPKLLEALGVG